ncbi:hypothetical protein K9P40_05020 [Lentilactobacillus otakiensis]|uniref:hypothetical protein n=1 Tax=Lentilactobacillus otakiensis TaxID=481720 RepID=UPI001CBCB854|nr:hypothetical protein [Lentilactobacillus otakiensis]MBZ3776436.1 hypothetical protein [Lentilactobacillus otakiensis]
MEAFHGTDLDHADSIIKNGFSLIEKLNRLPNDLGRGAYFFVENNFGLQPCEMAYRFAKIYGSNSHTIVLKADIETEKTLSINFDKPEQIIAFSKFRIQNSDYVKKQFNTYEEKGKCCSILKRGNLDGIW